MTIRYVQPRRFTTPEYRELVRSGVVSADGTELIDGVVVSGTRAYRFSSGDFLRLELEPLGVLDRDDRVELVDGAIAAMSAIDSRHLSCVARVTSVLEDLVPDVEHRTQDLLHLRDGLYLRPDVAVCRANHDRCEAAHPTAKDVLLVVEVADSSLLYDRTVKMEDYATAGVQEYWVVDLRRNVVIVSQKLVAGQFMDVREYGGGDTWQSPALGGAEIAVDDIIGKHPPG